MSKRTDVPQSKNTSGGRHKGGTGAKPRSGSAWAADKAKPTSGKPAGKPARKSDAPRKQPAAGNKPAARKQPAAGNKPAARKQQTPQTPLHNPPVSAFLPLTREDALARGWDQVDFVYVCGDAYVDHPSFGAALITRVLEANGYSVGIIAQPDWTSPDSVTTFGRPRLGFFVSSGNMDSMVNHCTVARKRRHEDAYSPGGKMGLRPDRATVVYSNLIRKVYGDVPIILGGIEASLRRLAHYDYWQDKMRRSVLLDANADLLSFGMGEHSVVEIADALASGLSVKDLTYINGTVYATRSLDGVYDAIMLPEWQQVQQCGEAYARSFGVQYANADPYTGKRLVEPYGANQYVVQNPPAEPLTAAELDAVAALPFTRTYHPSYQEAGGIPAIREVKFSLASSRGCFGECAFCALTFHQGRIIQARSHASLEEEARLLTQLPDFKGYLHDVGGPTANFRKPACSAQLRRGACVGKRCLAPEPCKKLEVDHRDYLTLLRRLRKLPGVKKVFVRSGVRFDYVMLDHKQGREFLRELCEHHVSGQLKVAPEHVSNQVLSVMGKPSRQVYDQFCQAYRQINQQLGKSQFLVPYLMSSHPGSTLDAAIELAEYVRDLGYMPEQVQDFYPTPSTVATVMYATGLDPRTLKPVYVPKDPHEKALQRALIQYRKPQNAEMVREALRKAGREDLIGFDKQCLVRPAKGGTQGKASPKNGTKAAYFKR